MNSVVDIITTKVIYPQIYAYIIPNYLKNKGWIKIGYTEQKNVNTRIKQQTQTASLDYELLWSEPAKLNTTNEWFKDKQFHTYLRKHKQVKQRENTEWFFYNETPTKALEDLNDFKNGKYQQSNEQLDYQLRAEQREAVEQTLQYAKENPDGEFLWNAKPRFGKTLTTYDLARQLDVSKVLIVTNRPAIANSWFNDFEKFIAWQTDFAFVSTSDSLKNSRAITREQFLEQTSAGKKKMLAFISLQDLKGAISFGGNYDKLAWVKDTLWDLLVIDESHEGVDTFKTDIAFDNITRNFTLHLSGTPFKALATNKFSQDEIYNWTYEDEQEAKVQWNNPEENNPYESLPRLNLFSYQMSQAITDEVNEGAHIDGKDTAFAFDLNEFFETHPNGKFIHEADVKKWLDTLSRNEKYPFSTKELRNELKHTFWLMHRVAGAKALEKLLRDHPVFENYKIVIAAGDGQSDDDEQIINQKSFDRVKAAIKDNEKTITLSVGQLTTGITVPEWTAVLMLSNMKSPSLYMQAAFRAQNAWSYEINGEIRQKENAYVFDFAPERTLTIYDEFANNLSSQTSRGHGTSEQRKENIKKLLNFFPVIAEDDEGKMVELDVNQVLTIPKVLKAQEVVRRGFMSNLLFQNISGIFASKEAREILEQLNPVDAGKSVPRQNEQPIDTQDIQVDAHGDVYIDQDIVLGHTNAHFGKKVYADIQATVNNITNSSSPKLSDAIAKAFKESTQDIIKGFAKEQGLATHVAEAVVQHSKNVIAREIEVVQKKTAIKYKEVEVEYQQLIAESSHDTNALAQAKVSYEQAQKQIEEDFKKDVSLTVETKTQELIQQSTQTILEKAEDKKKNTVEDDVRARLRGFSRTIPSFLMAYGEPTTQLANFDCTIKDSIFTEVTGISLAQFRILRDEFNFFDEMVFNQSVQEFLNKRAKLANYFDESQVEDIFDYIPPQKTNQIFTPKRVVKMMVDHLEKENPDIFQDETKTFADLYVKSGLYLTEIIKRLYIGLEDKIPDSDERLKHILENQIYGFAPSEIIYNIARNFIFGFDQKAKNINDSHIVCLDTTPYAKGQDGFDAKCNELFKGNKS